LKLALVPTPSEKKEDPQGPPPTKKLAYASKEAARGSSEKMAKARRNMMAMEV
jgi:hypothetical protein